MCTTENEFKRCLSSITTVGRTLRVDVVPLECFFAEHPAPCTFRAVGFAFGRRGSLFRGEWSSAEHHAPNLRLYSCASVICMWLVTTSSMWSIYTHDFGKQSIENITRLATCMTTVPTVQFFPFVTNMRFLSDDVSKICLTEHEYFPRLASLSAVGSLFRGYYIC